MPDVQTIRVQNSVFFIHFLQCALLVSSTGAGDAKARLRSDAESPVVAGCTVLKCGCLTAGATLLTSLNTAH